MEIKANRALKILYCLTLVGSIFPAWFGASSGWIGLILGTGYPPRSGFPFPVLLLSLFVLRIIWVVHNPAALDIYSNGTFVRVMRIISIFLMSVGLASMTGLFFVKPITMMIFKSAGDGGIGYFAVRVYLVILTGLGILGVVAYEIVRLFNLKGSQGINQEPTLDSYPFDSAFKFTPALLTKTIIALVILIALGFLS